MLLICCRRHATRRRRCYAMPPCCHYFDFLYTGVRRISSQTPRCASARTRAARVMACVDDIDYGVTITAARLLLYCARWRALCYERASTCEIERERDRRAGRAVTTAMSASRERRTLRDDKEAAPRYVFPAHTRRAIIFIV